MANLRGDVANFHKDLLKALRSQQPARMVTALKQIQKVGVWAANVNLDFIVKGALGHSTAAVQEHSILALVALGERGAQHVDLVVNKLTSSNAEKQVKIAAMQAIPSMAECRGISAHPQFWRLLPGLLESEDLDLVEEACRAAGQLKAKSTAPTLMSLMQSGDVGVAVAACGALASMDLHLDEIAQLLSHQHFKLRTAALRAFKLMSQVEKYDTQVVQLVGDSDPTVRTAAAEVVCQLGAKAKTQAPVLGSMLRDQNPGIVAAAATALGGIGAAAVSEVAGLEAVLSQTREDASDRPQIVAGVGPKAPVQLRKPACAVAAALGAMGVAAAGVAPRLVAALSNADSDLRQEALRALGSLGKVGSRFEPKVLERLADPSPDVVAAACEALGSFASAGVPSSTVADAVGKLLNSKHPQVRAAACTSLSCMGAEAEAHLNTFLTMFDDSTVAVQVAAIRAVAKCGEQGQMRATAISRMMEGGHPHVRIAAISALQSMGARGRAFYNEIAYFWDDPQVGPAACAALEAFEEANRQAEGAGPEDSVDLGYGREPDAPHLQAALLFPGQGSQYVKMMTEVQELPNVKVMAEKAKAILGYDIVSICVRGPEELLEQTRVCQPAMFIAGLAALEALKKSRPDVVYRKKAVAGLSLGEYTALCAAGVFDFETGLRLVKLRGEAMQEAAEASPQMMVSIAGLERETLNRLCQESKTSSTDICTVANFLFPLGFSCAGSRPAVERLQQKALKEPGCLQAKVLKTSGAFHTEFMKPAKAKLLKALIEVEHRMRPPRCEVYMNVTGKKIPAGTPVADIVDMLGTQLTRCVEWDTCMKGMIADGITEFYECGPMKQLKAMMKRISPSAWENTNSIMV